jgi:hypothetical protein
LACEIRIERVLDSILTTASNLINKMGVQPISEMQCILNILKDNIQYKCKSTN